MSVLYVFGEHVQQLKAYLFISIKKVLFREKAYTERQQSKTLILSNVGHK